MLSLAYTSAEAQVRRGVSAKAIWELPNWNEFHKTLAMKFSCLVKIGNVVLRFFLKPLNQETQTNDSVITMSFYSLWVELVSKQTELFGNVKVCIDPLYPGNHNIKKIWSLTTRCDLAVTANQLAQTKEILLEEKFIYMGSTRVNLNERNSFENPVSKTCYHSETPELFITFNITFCHPVEPSKSGRHSKTPKTNEHEKTDEQEKMVSLHLDPECQKWCDIRLKMKDNVTLKAHKTMLAVKSPVFRKMFTCEMKETTENIVEISDIGSQAMKVILNFIYTDEVDETWKDNVVEVVYAAAKYDLPKMLQYFNVNAYQVCNINNAVELYKLAKLYNLETAMEELVKFTRENTADVLLGLDF